MRVYTLPNNPSLAHHTVVMYKTNDSNGRDAVKRYNITEDGRVFNKEGQELKQFLNQAGYMTVSPYVNGRQQMFRVHRLVAIKYIGYKPKHAINHKDGNKLNNHYTNLEYVSLQDNLKHYWQNSKFHDRIKLDLETASKVRKRYHKEKISIAELARQYDVTRKYMGDVLDNKYWIDPLYKRERFGR